MTTLTKTMAATSGGRDDELRTMLEDHRRELLRDVQERIRDARTDVAKERQVLDQGESSEVDTQEDIEFALIQMKADMANKIDVALRRLDEDTYGVCFDCGGRIAERRLRAFPSRFAAKTVKKLMRLSSGVSRSWRVAVPHRSLPKCPANTQGPDNRIGCQTGTRTRTGSFSHPVG